MKKPVFLFDASGALLSAVLLGIALPALRERIGMPVETLYLLAAIAVGFLVYSSCAYFLAGKKWAMMLKGIIIGNTAYAVLSAGLVVYHYPLLTKLGVGYFVLEILVLAGVVWLEVRALSREGEISFSDSIPSGEQD